MISEQTVSVPSVTRDLVVEQLSHYIVVESRQLGFRLQWDEFDYINLEVGYLSV